MHSLVMEARDLELVNELDPPCLYSVFAEDFEGFKIQEGYHDTPFKRYWISVVRPSTLADMLAVIVISWEAAAEKRIAAIPDPNWKADQESFRPARVQRLSQDRSAVRSFSFRKLQFL